MKITTNYITSYMEDLKPGDVFRFAGEEVPYMIIEDNYERLTILEGDRGCINLQTGSILSINSDCEIVKLDAELIIELPQVKYIFE